MSLLDQISGGLERAWGSLTPLLRDATLIRKEMVAGAEVGQLVATDTQTAVKVAVANADDRLVASGLAERADRVITVLGSDLTFTPDTTMELILDGHRYKVIGVKNPGDLGLVFELQVR